MTLDAGGSSIGDESGRLACLYSTLHPWCGTYRESVESVINSIGQKSWCDVIGKYKPTPHTARFPARETQDDHQL
jgi:hypothetical protein